MHINTIHYNVICRTRKTKRYTHFKNLKFPERVQIKHRFVMSKIFGALIVSLL